MENVAEPKALLTLKTTFCYRLGLQWPSSQASFFLKSQNMEGLDGAPLIHYLPNDFDLLISGIYQVYSLLQYFVNRYTPQWGHH